MPQYDRGMRSPALAAVTAALAVLAPSVAGANNSASGLRGTVSLTPATPVCRDDDCTKPVRNYTLVFTRAGKSPVRVVTGAEGSYRVMLPPGTYRVSALRLRPPQRVTPATVRVRRGQVTVVDLLVDTGVQ